MAIGEKIAALRNEHNFSQGNLAEKMNVSRQSISKWETDTSVPDLDKLILLSEIFHISIDELVKGDECSSAFVESTPSSGSEIPAYEIQSKSKREAPYIDERTQKIRFALIIAGLICSALGIFAFQISGFLGIYVILCANLCISLKSYVVFVIAWLTIIPLALFSSDFKQIFGDNVNTALICTVWLLALVSIIWYAYKGKKGKDK